ncbi:YrzI family small protein [Cytobacillus firmus]|uniref:YrzI family small protein n=1 Tax=Cytobacillus firmus TaxID=1399 RepID=UPI003001C80C
MAGRWEYISLRLFYAFWQDMKEEVEYLMTLNILFLTVTIKKRHVSAEDVVREQMVKKIIEQNRDRQFSIYRPF